MVKFNFSCWFVRKADTGKTSFSKDYKRFGAELQPVLQSTAELLGSTASMQSAMKDCSAAATAPGKADG